MDPAERRLVVDRELSGALPRRTHAPPAPGTAGTRKRPNRGPPHGQGVFHHPWRPFLLPGPLGRVGLRSLGVTNPTVPRIIPHPAVLRTSVGASPERPRCPPPGRGCRTARRRPPAPGPGPCVDRSATPSRRPPSPREGPG